MDMLKNWSGKIVDNMFRHQHAAPSHAQGQEPIVSGREL
jgi:HAE1 family hydrophobic/amphiphilic exporter-1